MTDPILITGGATRLGFALAMHYLNNDQPVVLTYRTERPEVGQLTAAGAVCIHADFSTDDGIYQASELLQEQCQRLQSIVHNASSWFADPGGHHDLENLALMMRIHVGAPMVFSDALHQALRQAHNPAIVNVSDHVANRRVRDTAATGRDVAFSAARGHRPKSMGTPPDFRQLLPPSPPAEALPFACVRVRRVLLL